MQKPCNANTQISSATEHTQYGLLTMSVDRFSFEWNFSIKYFVVMTPGKEKEVDGRSIERESIGGSIGYG